MIAAIKLYVRLLNRLDIAGAITSGHATLAHALTELEGITQITANTTATRWLQRLTKGYLTNALTAAKNNGITLIDPNTIPGLSDLRDHAPHTSSGHAATSTSSPNPPPTTVGNPRYSSWRVSVMSLSRRNDRVAWALSDVPRIVC